MMNTKDEAFLKKLLETFAQEAQEHIDKLSQGLLELKKSSDANSSNALVETLFREAHSFKGAARAVNILEIEELCKAMEDIFNQAKRSEETIGDPLIEKMLECNDMLSVLSTTNEDKRRDLRPKVHELIEILHETSHIEKTPIEKIALKVITKKESHEITPSLEVQKEPIEEAEIKIEETLLIPVKKLHSIMHRSEEMLLAKMVAKRHVDDLSTIANALAESIKTLQNSSHDELLKRSNAILSLIDSSIKQFKGDAREINMMVDRLLENMKEALMLPFSSIFSTLPKIVHDMAKSVGKDISLTVVGADIEIDRRISEQMHDPIMHLLRNSIDHAIVEQGTITLTLTQKSASKIELFISDDGIGIDAQKIRQSAVDKAVLTKHDADLLDDESTLDLIFRSGVSTTKSVSDLSGRGLGLAIVKEKSELLGGKVHVTNNKERGCTFAISLPLSISTFRGVITSLAKQRFIFASESIVRVMTIKRQEIKTIEGKEMVTVDHHVTPYYHLSTILGSALLNDGSNSVAVVVIRSAHEMLAIGVDAVEYEEEVMVKSLGKQLQRVQNISGVSLLASDEPALILNISDIFKSITTLSRKTIAPQKKVLKKRSKILVVDDSPTTRALLENILEMVGYDVVSVVDGLKAFELLKDERFDLVVSDVDMPIMNGFELTRSIRSDTKTSELPVILVTSLESHEDKRHGMHVGANAYLIKSTFDQNDLIDTIRSLID